MKRLLLSWILFWGLHAGLAVPVTAADLMVSHNVPHAKLSQAADYWTRERMTHAKPYPYNAIPGKAPVLEGSLKEAISGPPIAVKSRMPEATSALLTDMVETQASLATVFTDPSPDTTGVGTSQRPGFSGGPWILKFTPGSAGAVNYANGVNSMYFKDSPDQIFSPYFDTSVSNMRNTAIAKK
jgi:hypothetical protein